MIKNRVSNTDTQFQNTLSKLNYSSFEMAAEFFIAGMIAQKREGCVRMLLDDKRAAARLCCDRSVSSVLEFGFQLEPLVSSHTVDDMNEGVFKIFRTGAATYTVVVVAQAPVDGRTTMSSESVCQVTRSWVDVGSFHTRLVVRFMNFTASVRNILGTPSYTQFRLGRTFRNVTTASVYFTYSNIKFMEFRVACGFSTTVDNYSDDRDISRLHERLR
jgi:hypothetical protein